MNTTAKFTQKIDDNELYFSLFAISNIEVTIDYNIDDTSYAINCASKFNSVNTNELFPPMKIYDKFSYKYITNPFYVYILKQPLISQPFQIHIILLASGMQYLDGLNLLSQYIFTPFAPSPIHSAGIIQRDSQNLTKIHFDIRKSIDKNIVLNILQTIIPDILIFERIEPRINVPRRKISIFDIYNYSPVKLTCSQDKKTGFLSENIFKYISDKNRPYDLFMYKYDFGMFYPNNTSDTETVIELTYMNEKSFILKQCIKSDNNEIYISKVLNLLSKYLCAPSFPILIDDFTSNWKIYYDPVNPPIQSTHDNFHMNGILYDNIVMNKYEIDINSIDLQDSEKAGFAFGLYYSLYIAYKKLKFSHGNMLLSEDNNILYTRQLYPNKTHVCYVIDDDKENKKYFIFDLINFSMPIAIMHNFKYSNLNIDNTNIIVNKMAFSKNVDYNNYMFIYTNLDNPQELNDPNYPTDPEDLLDGPAQNILDSYHLYDEYNAISEYRIYSDILGINKNLSKIQNMEQNNLFVNQILPGDEISILQNNDKDLKLKPISIENLEHFFSTNYINYQYNKNGNSYININAPYNEVVDNGNILHFNFNDTLISTKIKSVLYDTFDHAYNKYKLSFAIYDMFKIILKKLADKTADLGENGHYYISDDFDFNFINKSTYDALLTNIKNKNNIDVYKFATSILSKPAIKIIAKNKISISDNLMNILEFVETNSLFSEIKYLILLCTKLYDIKEDINIKIIAVLNINTINICLHIRTNITKTNINILLANIVQPDVFANQTDINDSKFENILNNKLSKLLQSRLDNNEVSKLLISLLFMLDEKINHTFNFINNSDYDFIDKIKLLENINKVKVKFFNISNNKIKFYIKYIFDIYNVKSLTEMLLTNNETIEKKIEHYIYSITVAFHTYRDLYRFDNVLKYTLINFMLLDALHIDGVRVFDDPDLFKYNSKTIKDTCNIIKHTISVNEQLTFVNILYKYKEALKLADSLLVPGVNIVKLFTGEQYSKFNSAIYAAIYDTKFNGNMTKIEMQLYNDYNDQIYKLFDNMYDDTTHIMNLFTNKNKAIKETHYYVYRAEDFIYSYDNILSNLELGDLYVLQTHTSTTIEFKKALAHKDILLKIKMNTYSKCLLIFNYSDSPKENEILLSYGTLLRVTGKNYYHKDNKIKLVIDMEYEGRLSFNNINEFINYYKNIIINNKMLLSAVMEKKYDIAGGSEIKSRFKPNSSKDKLIKEKRIEEEKLIKKEFLIQDCPLIQKYPVMQENKQLTRLLITYTLEYKENNLCIYNNKLNTIIYPEDTSLPNYTNIYIYYTTNTCYLPTSDEYSDNIIILSEFKIPDKLNSTQYINTTYNGSIVNKYTNLINSLMNKDT